MEKSEIRKLNYVKTLKPEEVEGFIKSVQATAREARCVERGMHGGGGPYPVRIGFWSRLFSFL